MNSKLKILVTGVAGFIGFHLTKRLCDEGHHVIGIDNLNDYYDVQLKRDRLTQLNVFVETGLFKFHKIDIADLSDLEEIFKETKIDIVMNLAAQAGVRYSLENPHEYIRSNIQGFINILECCRYNNVSKLIYASSSSVYGGNVKLPFSELDRVDTPISIYAASKKSNELMAHTYSHLFGLNTIGLRFFTVYGPWGRPDMAPFIFTKKILAGEIIDINNNGDMWRDFTYIDDIVEGVVRAADVVPVPKADWKVETGSPATSSAPYTVYNIGHGSPINLMKFIEAIEAELGIEANKNFREMQAGDVYKTYADTQDLFEATGYKADVGVKKGVSELIKWYKSFYS